MRASTFAFAAFAASGVFGALVASCYSPNLTGAAYSCDVDVPLCPEDYICLAGKCVPPGTIPGPPDSTTDGGPPTGAMPAKGCRSGFGFDVGMPMKERFACPGQFGNGNRCNSNQNSPPGSNLCADGYSVCADGAGIDFAKCKAAGGFFASNVSAGRYGTAGGQLQGYDCNGPKNNMSRMWVGCGASGSSIFDVSPCSGFTQVIDCYDATDWSCLAADNLSDANNCNSDPKDGVLCCK